MPMFKLHVPSYRNGVLYPAGAIVESELKDATTGSIPVDEDGEEVGPPVTKKQISEAAEAARKVAESAPASVAKASKPAPKQEPSKKDASSPL